MLKIKDNVDLKELEKYGFEEYEGGENYYCDLIPYTEQLHAYLEVIVSNRELKVLDYVDYDYHNKAIEKLFDLIQAGLVEKVLGGDSNESNI